ncbi:MAG: Ig-like domain-containing protein, partial [Acidobacteriota bacterium]
TATALAPGVATIRAVLQNVEDATAEMGIKEVDAITIRSDRDVACSSDRIVFNADGSCEQQTTVDMTDRVTWISDDTVVLPVFGNGNSIAGVPGLARVTATYEDLTSNEIPITVLPADLLTISPSQATIEEEGTIRFEAVTTCRSRNPNDVSTLANWSSSDPGVATVGFAGNATGVTAGTTDIQATYEGLTSNQALLTVVAPDPPNPLFSGGGGVVINEIVEQPIRDWDDSVGGDGVEFNADPGSAAADPRADQWIELYNTLGAGTAFLGDWTLEYTDTNGAKVVKQLQGFLTAGEFLVIGPLGPDGMDRESPIVLKLLGVTADVVDLSTMHQRWGYVSSPIDEALVRTPNGVDTNRTADFRRGRPTPGEPNP